jgi:hypothetical protein
MGPGSMGQPVLPRRVRQASLVPQLRNAPPAYPPLPGRYGDTRPPDEARATVSAIQHGWERGRSMFDPAPAPPPEAGPPEAGPPEAGAPEAGAPEAGAPEAGAPDAGAPDAGESGTAHGEGGDDGAYQQEMPIEDRGPHGPG